jgi:uncharacterized membrane protein (DUF2068 family)
MIDPGYGAGIPVRPPRPRRVTTAGVLLIVLGALGVLLSFFVIALLHRDQNNGDTVSGGVFFLLYLQLVLSAAEAVAGILLLQGRGWARIVAIVLCSINLAGAVISLFTGAGGSVITGILINVALIRLLTREEVVEWCR